MVAKKRRADFSNVRDGGNFSPKHRDEGDYIMKIISVEDGESNAGNEQTVFTLIVASDANKARPATYPYYCGWDDKQLWKIRKLFIAAGIPVPKKAVVVDPNKLLNKTIGAALEDDEYEGRMRSRIADVFPKDDVKDSPVDDTDADDDYEEEEEAPPVRKRAAKRAPEPDEDEDEEDAPPPRRRTPAKKTTSRRPAAEDDDEDDEDEAPPPRRRTPAKKAASTKRRPPADDDEDEDVEDLDLDEI